MDLRTAMLEAIRTERRLTKESIAAMADGDMAFRATPEQMPFGEQALHLLSAHATLVDALEGKEWVWDQGMTLEKYPTQEAILELLDRESARLFSFVEGLEPDGLGRVVTTPWGSTETVLQLLVCWISHEAHHRGQMVTYLRLKGMAPAKY